MKQFLIVFSFGILAIGCAKKTEKPNVKSLLLEQLKNTHTDKNWFVPTKVALKDLTYKQANKKDNTGNNSISELVSHMIFWNESNLLSFKGNTLADFNGNNDSTFRKYNEQEWKIAIKHLDSIQTAWEDILEYAIDDQLLEWSSEIANMSAHTAYHTGQIVYIRKQNGWWNN